MRILPQSFKKSLIGPQKTFLKKIKLGIKNAEFYAEYKTVGKNAKMITKKVIYKKKPMYK